MQCVNFYASAHMQPQPLKHMSILHAPDAKRAQPSLAALKEHAVTVVHRGGDVGAAARTAATTADTIILYDARHAPLQHTLDWNTTIKTAKACAALLPDDVERVGTARKANGIVLSNREARKASGATINEILTTSSVASRRCLVTTTRNYPTGSPNHAANRGDYTSMGVATGSTTTTRIP